MSLAVRRVRPGEADLLRTVRLAALADSPAAFTDTWEEAAAQSEDVWAERARRGADGDDLATFLLVEGEPAATDAEALGLVVGHRPGPDRSRVELASMWVHPARRRHGGGRLLVEAVVGWARATGADAVDLWVVRSNGGAAAFYERLGFARTAGVDVAPDDPCRDELRMTRPLRLVG